MKTTHTNAQPGAPMDLAQFEGHCTCFAGAERPADDCPDHGLPFTKRKNRVTAHHKDVATIALERAKKWGMPGLEACAKTVLRAIAQGFNPMKECRDSYTACLRAYQK